MISLHFDAKFIEQQLARLKKIPAAAPKALYPAVQEVIGRASQALTRKLARDLPLPDSLIRSSVKILPVRFLGSGVEARLRVSSKQVPLIKYEVTPKEITARKGVRSKEWPSFAYSLRKGRRYTSHNLLGHHDAKGLPFIAAMSNRGKGGHLGVYHRTFANKVKEIQGPRVQYHACTPEMELLLQNKAEDYFYAALPRFVDRILAGAK